MMPRMRDEVLLLAGGAICSPSMELQQLWGQDDIHQPKQNQYFQFFLKAIFSLSEKNQPQQVQVMFLPELNELLDSFTICDEQPIE